jgi:predicted lipoprotein with Yx(FWY)xxD motif
MSRSSAGVLSAIAAVAIAVAGCGGGKSYGGESSSKNSATTTSSATTSAAKGGAASSQAVIVAKSAPVLGTILAAGPKKLTVYIFEADKGTTSACYGACASAWPPVLTNGAPKAEGGASASKLGTTKRSDGTTQVTYGGHPLYYYSPDTSESSTTGQGVNSFGALWYVLSPGGEVIKKA